VLVAQSEQMLLGSGSLPLTFPVGHKSRYGNRVEEPLEVCGQVPGASNGCLQMRCWIGMSQDAKEPISDPPPVDSYTESELLYDWICLGDILPWGT